MPAPSTHCYSQRIPLMVSTGDPVNIRKLLTAMSSNCKENKNNTKHCIPFTPSLLSMTLNFDFKISRIHYLHRQHACQVLSKYTQWFNLYYVHMAIAVFAHYDFDPLTLKSIRLIIGNTYATCEDHWLPTSKLTFYLSHFWEQTYHSTSPKYL